MSLYSKVKSFLCHSRILSFQSLWRRRESENPVSSSLFPRFQLLGWNDRVRQRNSQKAFTLILRQAQDKLFSKVRFTSLLSTNFHKKARGFTLIELLIVIGILAILATITLLVLNPA